MSTQNEQSHKNDKPILLKAIETILADPAEIKRATIDLKEKFRKEYSDEPEEEIKSLTADKIISNYSFYTAFVGGGAALPGVIPGLGQAVAVGGGAAADVALTMKFQIEMTMAIATVYDHNIEIEEERRLCLIIAGLGAINEAVKKGGKQVGTKAFIKMTQQYLKGSTLVAVKQVFRRVGVTFARKALEKAIPFGVGVIIGFSANKGLTWYVGKKAKDFFSVYK